VYYHIEFVKSLPSRRMLRTGSNFVPLERKRSGFAPKPCIHATRVAELITSLTPSPDRGMVSVTMAAFRSGVVHIRFIRGIPVIVGVDELLRAKFVSLLQIEATSVA
jgi:hypothetical protein